MGVGLILWQLAWRAAASPAINEAEAMEAESHGLQASATNLHQPTQAVQLLHLGDAAADAGGQLRRADHDR